MRASLQVLVVALVSLLVVSSAVGCDSSDCLPGPVLAEFVNDNCTDLIGFINILTPVDETCNSGYISKLEGDEIFAYSNINNANCDITLPNATYNYLAYKLGICIPAGSISRSAPGSLFGRSSLVRDTEIAAQSFMFLASVNATYTAQSTGPSTNVNNLPELESSEILCYSPNNCTDMFGEVPPIIFTEYSEPGNCSSAVNSIYFNTTRIGVCYWYNPRTVTLQCRGEHGYEGVLTLGEDCTRPYGRNGYVAHCEGGAIGLSCQAPSSPFTVAPPSTASSLHLAPFAFVILALLAIVL